MLGHPVPPVGPAGEIDDIGGQSLLHPRPLPRGAGPWQGQRHGDTGSCICISARRVARERFFVGLCQGFAEAGVEQRFVVRPDRVWSQDIAALGPVIESHYRRIAPSSLWLTWPGASHGAGLETGCDHGLDVAILAPDPGLCPGGEAHAAG